MSMNCCIFGKFDVVVCGGELNIIIIFIDKKNSDSAFQLSKFWVFDIINNNKCTCNFSIFILFFSYCNHYPWMQNQSRLFDINDDLLDDGAYDIFVCFHFLYGFEIMTTINLYSHFQRCIICKYIYMMYFVSACVFVFVYKWIFHVFFAL